MQKEIKNSKKIGEHRIILQKNSHLGTLSTVNSSSIAARLAIKDYLEFNETACQFRGDLQQALSESIASN